MSKMQNVAVHSSAVSPLSNLIVILLGHNGSKCVQIKWVTKKFRIMCTIGRFPKSILYLRQVFGIAGKEHHESRQHTGMDGWH